MFYSIAIYFCSQLSYFVSNRSDERLREDLGRDKPSIFRILSTCIDLMSTRICKQSYKLACIKVLTTLADSGYTIILKVPLASYGKNWASLEEYCVM